MTLSSDNKTCIVHTYTNASGTIYLKPPSANAVTHTIILNEKSKVVKLEFESIVKCSDGYVQVFDGNSTKSLEIGKYCDLIPKDITSSTNELTIKYKSSATSNDTTLSYTTVEPPEFSKPELLELHNIHHYFFTGKKCDILIMSPTVFSLDTFPGVYGEDGKTKECTFYIAKNKIKFQLLYTDLDCDNCSSSNCTDKLTFHIDINYNVNVGAMCNAKGQTEFDNRNYKFLIIRFTGTSTGKYRGFKGRIL